jgi:hypothetical protein
LPTSNNGSAKKGIPLMREDDDDADSADDDATEAA